MNRSGAIFAAMACAVAGLFLVACGKSATQYIDRGNQLYSSGQYGDAALNYRNAIKKTPGSGEAYYRLGLALLKQNQMGEAYQAFNRATTLSPANMRAKVRTGESRAGHLCARSTASGGALQASAIARH